jgi:hypothetical protein
MGTHVLHTTLGSIWLYLHLLLNLAGQDLDDHSSGTIHAMSALFQSDDKRQVGVTPIESEI